ncbi:uncharacterized protein [Amphiura filiformis]|uniref:uncharacterized protein n=1 Tax=Amphiura filiformis TaxID=82378 RepID=UPI003B223D7D
MRTYYINIQQSFHPIYRNIIMDSINELRVQADDRYIGHSRGSHGNYHSAIILVFLLGTLGVALAFAPVLVLPSYNPIKLGANVTNFNKILGGILALTVATTSLCLVIGKRRLEEKGYVQFSITSRTNRDVNHSTSGDNRHRNSRSRVYKNVNRCQTILFGIGGAIYLVIGLVQNISEDTFEEMAASVAEKVMHLISLMTQMVFLIKYEGALLQNVTLLHYAIALMIADKVWMWISLTLSSAADIAYQTDANNSNSTHWSLLETSESFLEPIYIEFLITCVGIFLYMWSSMGKNVQRRFDVEPESDDEVYSPNHTYGSIITESEERRRLLSNDGDSESQRDWFNSRSNSELQYTSTLFLKIAKRVGVLLVVIVSIGYSIVGFILRDGPLEYITDSIGPYNRLNILLGIKIALFGPLTVLCMISAYRMYKRPDITPPSFPNDYLLLGATAGIFLWFLFKLIAATVNTEENPLTFIGYIAVQVVCILHIWVQTQFLLGAQSIHSRGYRLSALTQACLVYLAGSNASEWLQVSLERETLIHNHGSKISPVLNAVYGDKGNLILIYVLYPFIELFRFHSVVMAYEILI